MNRRLTCLLAAVVLATGLLALPAGVVEVRAAAPDLTMVTDARYDVQPEQHRVHVTVDMVLTNHLHDTATQRFYFTSAFLSVLPATSGYKLSWTGSGTPKVKVSKTTSTDVLLELTFAQRLYSGKSASYRLVFDLVDNGGEPARDVRIGSSLVSFPVWSYASRETPGSTVRVVFPPQFMVEVQSGDIPAPTTAADGTVVLQTSKLAAPLDFFAYLVADRAGATAEQQVSATVRGKPVELAIQGWPDDQAWFDRVGGLVARGLPILSERIGLDWPRDDGLIVRETISRTNGGYAGLFDPSAGEIDVAYDANDYIVMHEAAHSWFNGALLADRWSTEGFASYYGLEAVSALGLKATGDTLTPALEAARIPLNGWGELGRVDSATEDYAYAAALALARAIAERAGEARLQKVWADAAGRIGAYQPPVTAGGTGGAGGSETVTDAPDWRGLLDLLEADTTATYDDLWRTWVTRPTDLPALDARAAARTHYDAVVASAGDWQLPRMVRDAMRAWRFDQAQTLLDDAVRILEQRTAIATAAAASGLTASSNLRTAFESADQFANATVEGAAELVAIDRFDRAAATRPASPDVLQVVGLLGTAPDADLDRARSLFTAGDLGGSTEAAGVAAAAWSGAADVGRNRLVGSAAVVLTVLVGLALIVAWLRGRRRRRRDGMLADVGNATLAVDAATVDATPVVGAPDPYATLAATSDPTERVEVGEQPARGAEPD